MGPRDAGCGRGIGDVGPRDAGCGRGIGDAGCGRGIGDAGCGRRIGDAGCERGISVCPAPWNRSFPSLFGKTVLKTVTNPLEKVKNVAFAVLR